MELTDALALTGTQILAISSPDKLFPREFAGVRSMAAKLLSKWHPDKNKDVQANDVTVHLLALQSKASDQLAAGVWGSDRFKKYLCGTPAGQVEISFKYKHSAPIPDFGTQYIGEQGVYYEVSKDVYDLAENWVRKAYPAMLSKLKLFGSKHAAEFAQMEESAPKLYLISKDDIHEARRGGCVIYVPKPKSYLCLRDVIAAKGGLPAEHTTWVLSRLYSFACLMEMTDVPCMGLSTASIFIEPESHKAIVLEGWQYATGYGQTALAVPSKVARMNPEIAKTGKPYPTHLGRMIRGIGRECMGDPFGARLLTDDSIPLALRTWLLQAETEPHAIEEFKKWEIAKKKAWPVSQFINFAAKQEELYPA